MAKVLQHRRGTTAENDAFTGSIGEITVDTTKKRIRLHDGQTQGGYEVAPAKIVSSGSTESRVLEDRFADFINVKDFGAKGDGVSDDTSGIQSAIDHANEIGGGQILFPRGTYIVSGITIYSKISIRGEGRELSILKLKASSNANIINGFNVDTLWESSSASGVEGVGIFDMTLDGNKQNNSSGSGIHIYGEEFYFENLWIKNCAKEGISTRFHDSGTTFGMEAYYLNVRIDNCGETGWYNDGPHDCVAENVIIIDAGQEATNTYSGMVIGSNCNGRFIGCHVWNRSSSNRHKYAVQVLGDGNEFVACHFEGAWSANVCILSGKNIFDDSCRIYAPWNGVNIYIGGTATSNDIRGTISHGASGRPASVGVSIGSLSSDWIVNNTIDVQCTDQLNSCVVFGNGTVKNNRVSIKGYNSTESTIVSGNIDPSNNIDIKVTNGDKSYSASNTCQNAKVTIGSKSTYVYTFPFEFREKPIVVCYPMSGSTKNTWVSWVSKTQVCIYNDNESEVVLSMHAVVD